MNGRTRMARMIEWATHSRTHHVVVGIGNGMVVSAEPGVGVIIRPETDYPQLVWSRFEWTDEQADAIVSYAVMQQGRPYNFTAFILAGLLGAVGLHCPRWLASMLSSSRSVDCSQLAAEAINQAASYTDYPAWLIVPGDFQRLYERLGWPLTPTFSQRIS